MALLDRFLDAMKLNDDDEFDDDDFLDDEFDDDEDEVKPKNRFFKRFRDDDPDDDLDDDEPEVSSRKEKPRKEEKVSADKFDMPKSSARPVREKAAKKSKVTPIRKASKPAGMEVNVIRPQSMEDTRDIADTLMDNCTVVLNLEGKAGVETVLTQRGNLLLGAATDDGAHSQRHRAGIMSGLQSCHEQIVVLGDVVARIASPAQVEGLAFDGATGHVYQLGDYPHLRGVIESGVMHNGAVHQGQSQVALVDGKAQTLSKVQAGLAATGLSLIGDVVVNKGSRVEVLDGRRRRGDFIRVSSHRYARRNADERAMTLASILAVLGQRIIEVAVDVLMHVAMRDKRVDHDANLICASSQIVAEALHLVDMLDKDFIKGEGGIERSHVSRTFNQKRGRTGSSQRELVGVVGLEPTIPKEADFKSAAYANSATLPSCVAHDTKKLLLTGKCHTTP